MPAITLFGPALTEFCLCIIDLLVAVAKYMTNSTERSVHFVLDFEGTVHFSRDCMVAGA